MKKLFLILFIISTLFKSCSINRFINKIENGDIIFVEAENKNLSDAISRVTAKNTDSISYDHVALIEKKEGKYFVLHAAPKNGSEKIMLKDFIKNNSKHQKILALYRLKNNYQNCIANAINNANSMLGKPYNFSYVLNEEQLYCSDFIEKAYRNCQIFQLNPMTFINPKTNKIDDFWIKYYKEKGMDVPEGKLGCNPNGISKSEKIYRVAFLK